MPLHYFLINSFCNFMSFFLISFRIFTENKNPRTLLVPLKHHQKSKNLHFLVENNFMSVKFGVFILLQNYYQFHIFQKFKPLFKFFLRICVLTRENKKKSRQRADEELRKRSVFFLFFVCRIIHEFFRGCLELNISAIIPKNTLFLEVVKRRMKMIHPRKS